MGHLHESPPLRAQGAMQKGSEEREELEGTENSKETVLSEHSRLRLCWTHRDCGSRHRASAGPSLMSPSAGRGKWTRLPPLTNS